MDSSSDRTAESAQFDGQRSPSSLRRSTMNLRWALRSSSREGIVTLDCDDTYAVEFIEAMARMVLEDETIQLEDRVSQTSLSRCHGYNFPTTEASRPGYSRFL